MWEPLILCAEDPRWNLRAPWAGSTPCMEGEGRGRRPAVERLPTQACGAADAVLPSAAGVDAPLQGDQGLLGHLADHAGGCPVMEISELHCRCQTS